MLTLANCFCSTDIVMPKPKKKPQRAPMRPPMDSEPARTPAPEPLCSPKPASQDLLNIGSQARPNAFQFLSGEPGASSLGTARQRVQDFLKQATTADAAPASNCEVINESQPHIVMNMLLGVLEEKPGVPCFGRGVVSRDLPHLARDGPICTRHSNVLLYGARGIRFASSVR